MMNYKYVGLLAIVIMRVVHEPYRYARAHWEPAWQHAGHLEQWWLFSVGYFVLE